MTPWLIALLLVLGTALLGVWCWRLSVHAWSHRPVDDVAPRTQLPSLHELRARHRR